MKSILIIAGESSGEKYGARLVREFQKIRPDFSFFGTGGKQMAAEGVEILFPIDDLAVVGAVEILSSLPRIKRIYDRIKMECRKRRPSAAVLIDSPDFNLRLAKHLHQLSIPILYYISPTVWAWREGRLKTIKRLVTKMLLIFPFEVSIYSRQGIPAEYIGHPLLERIQALLGRDGFCKKYGLDPRKKLLTVLPGSRKSEIRYHMPILAGAIPSIEREFPAQFVILLGEGMSRDFLTGFLREKERRPFQDILFLTGDHYEAMQAADLVLSACGTANLEAALLGTPVVSFYRLSSLSFAFGIKLFKIRNFSIVNILAGETIIPELIQHRFTPENLVRESAKILGSDKIREKMRGDYLKIRAMLGDQKASLKAALELEKLIAGHSAL